MIINYLLKKRYPVNRRLTDKEWKYKLDCKQKTDVEPMDCLATIRINSTYLEGTDFYTVWRGLGTVGGIAIAYGLGDVIVNLLDISSWSKIWAESYGHLIIILSIIGIIIGLIIWVLCVEMVFFEIFRKTHYPIRLNRRNRMVYVCRRDGTVFSAHWDKLFFFLNPDDGFPRLWDVRAHVMDEDGITVKETIVLGYEGNQKGVIHFWEYLRRYMEEGPKDAYQKTLYCLPIDDRREPFHVGLFRLLMNFKGSVLAQIIFFPFVFVCAIGRFIASHTSRIPVWPKEIEDACTIEPGDPYVRTWRMNPSWFTLTPSKKL